MVSHESSGLNGKAPADYIANEDGDWDTSTAYLKKCAVKCIELGRSGLLDGTKHKDWWEALRLLGQVMHVMVRLSLPPFRLTVSHGLTCFYVSRLLSRKMFVYSAMPRLKKVTGGLLMIGLTPSSSQPTPTGPSCV